MSAGSEYERAELQRMLDSIDALDAPERYSATALLLRIYRVRQMIADLQDHLGGPIGE